MNEQATWLACVAGAYLIGSIPFGLLIGLARGVDVRRHGSKNIGATNVWRVLGRPWGPLCFALDVAKGVGPVLIAGWITGALEGRAPEPARLWWWLAVAVGAVMGHIFPLWLRFKGGKGVATGFGALAGVYPFITWPALLALALWLVAAKLTRYVSVASIIGAMSIPVSTVGFSLARADGTFAQRWASLGSLWPLFLVTFALAALVVWKHRANLARLRAGTELRIGERTVSGPHP